ncbi:MAG: 30S ribosomal protein S3 [Clostridiaceae bacterium]|nr:30S ribosomal protein S3 [Clostridiaceae bacterium]
MGQKVNPHGLRVGVIKGWDSRWFAKDELVGDLLVEDYNVRKYLKKTLYAAGVPKIEIERTNANVRIIIHCAKPGMIVGKGGADIQKLEKDLTAMMKKPAKVSIIEVRTPDLDAQLVAENIASQLERRISFRRAMKQCMARAMRLGAKGIKTAVAGRLGGAEIARTEHYHEGTIPLQTLRADIEYGFAEANTTYGKIGVKVWLYKGEVLTGGPRQSTVDAPKRDRRERRDGDRRPNNNSNYRGDRKPQGSYGQRPQQGGQRPPYRPSNNPGRPITKPEGGAQ